MSLTQTYYIASSARTKLGHEAGRADHDLRLLVGHANLLDSLMLELHNAEQEQEAWFNQTVRKAASSEEPKHIQWADTIVEEDEDDSASETSDSDSESEFDEEDFEMQIPLRRIRSPPVTVTTQEVEEDEDIYDDEYDEELALTRTPSNQPPELIHDSDESDDESPPTSPPQPNLEFSEKDRKTITSFFEGKIPESSQDTFMEEGFFIPQRTNAPLIAVA